MTEALEFADNVLKPMRLAYAANTCALGASPSSCAVRAPALWKSSLRGGQLAALELAS